MNSCYNIRDFLLQTRTDGTELYCSLWIQTFNFSRVDFYLLYFSFLSRCIGNHLMFLSVAFSCHIMFWFSNPKSVMSVLNFLCLWFSSVLCSAAVQRNLKWGFHCIHFILKFVGRLVSTSTMRCVR